jgi:predicted nucleic acid-binding protein
MRYVLDSNVSLKWVLTEADSDKARRLRSEFQNQIHELVAPDVFPVEAAHALARAERRRIIAQGDADRLLTNILSTPPQLLEDSVMDARRAANHLRTTDH